MLTVALSTLCRSRMPLVSKHAARHQSHRWLLPPWGLLLCAAAAAVQARPAPPSNGTISDDSNYRVYCERTNWYDVCWFFFSNYLLHALSVRSLPGENNYSASVFKLCCLLVPYTGVRRGLCLVSRASNLVKHDLQVAARAGALVMVVRAKDWRPKDGDTIRGCEMEQLEASSKPPTLLQQKHKNNGEIDEDNGGDVAPRSEKTMSGESNGLALQVKGSYKPAPPSSYLSRVFRILVETHQFRSRSLSSRLVDHENIKLHGYCKLAPGYALAEVPQHVRIIPRSASDEKLSKHSTRVSSTHDVPRVLFSLIQTVSGAYSLYKARGSQIDRYGYAAFGLTVLPYMVVSIINFIGSLLTSEYETTYVVHSPMMDEMVQRGGAIDGAIETLGELESQELDVGQTKDTVQFSCSKDRVACRSMQSGVIVAVRILDHPTTNRKRNLIAELHETTMLNLWYQRRIRRREKRAKQCIGPTISIPSHAPLTPIEAPIHQTALNIFTLFLLFLALAVPWLIIGLLSGFHGNQSTSVQKNFVLVWLIAGQLQGYVAGNVEKFTGKNRALKALLLVFMSYGANCL